MTTIHCTRCNQDREQLERPPMPTEVGKKVYEKICSNCWHEWMTMSTKVINEYRLALFRPEHREILENQMKLFLNLT